jgi:glucose/mannose transport system permease protein
MSTATATTTPTSARSKRRRWGPLVRFVILMGIASFVLIPAYVLIVTSLKPAAETTASQAWALPVSPTLDGWRQAWEALREPMLRSVALAVPAALLSSTLGCLNGFVLSKWKFPGADLLFTLLLFGMFIPYQAVMIPLTQIVRNVGLPSGIPTLIFVHTVFGLPITTLIFRNYFATTLPDEMLEAAQVDGAGQWSSFLRIALPLSIPGFVVAIIWQFTSVWNDFLFAIFLSNSRNGPVTIALQALAGGQLTNYSASMAGALIASLPTLLVYVFLGKYFIGGLMSGSLKG